MRLIIATKNQGKLREIREILKGIDFKIISLANLSKKFRIIENGKTFVDNAVKKAITVSKVYKHDYVVGEDSGLEVNYLNGEPGVNSKRYSGKNATSIKNNRKLLKKLDKVTGVKRKASFFCCLVLAYGGETVKVFTGQLVGVIATKSRGENGFGYDPIFYLSKYSKTTAQMPLKFKNKISHRAKAFKKLRSFLKNYPC